MKRTPLKRKKALQARPPGRGGLRKVLVRKPPPRVLEPGESLWKQRRMGRCAVCGKRGPVVLHHLVEKQTVRKEGGDPYDQRNALPIGAPYIWGGKCRCHDRHTTPGVNPEDRLDFRIVTPEGKEFAVETLGEGPAINHWRRYYRNAP